jgi:hypothetical protein
MKNRREGHIDSAVLAIEAIDKRIGSFTIFRRGANISIRKI